MRVRQEYETEKGKRKEEREKNAKDKEKGRQKSINKKKTAEKGHKISCQESHQLCK